MGVGGETESGGEVGGWFTSWGARWFLENTGVGVVGIGVIGRGMGGCTIASCIVVGEDFDRSRGCGAKSISAAVVKGRSALGEFTKEGESNRVSVGVVEPGDSMNGESISSRGESNESEFDFPAVPMGVGTRTGLGMESERETNERGGDGVSGRRGANARRTRLRSEIECGLLM